MSDCIPSAERDERILESIELTTPSQLLDHDFFDVLKVRPRGNIIDNYTGELDGDVRFEFNEKANRYTDPKTCKYQSYIFFDPKNATTTEKQDLKNRYKCELASQSNLLVTSISPKQFLKMKKWLSKIMNSYDVKQSISKKETTMIINTAQELFQQFVQRHYITSTRLYAIMTVCTMYASFYHILAYISPFNNFKFWYAQRKMDKLTNGDLEDVYKQFCGFIARHIENT